MLKIPSLLTGSALSWKRPYQVLSRPQSAASSVTALASNSY